MIFGYLFLMVIKFARKDYCLQKHENAFLLLPGVMTLCVSITLKKMILSMGKNSTVLLFENMPEAMFWISLICVLLLGVNLSSVILFQKLIQCGEEEKKRILLKNQTVHMRRELRELQDIYDDMRGLKHDLRNHIESITHVIQNVQTTESGELEDYIGEMEETVRRLDFSCQTGNTVTDMIIYRKMQEAKRRRISFYLDFAYPQKNPIDAYDLGIILTNALENAVEASGRVEGEKEMWLRSYTKGSLFFIETENDFSGEIIFDPKTGFPISSKKDARFHGVGLKNIQRCAAKYKGGINIAEEMADGRKKFRLTVMMYEK